MPTHSFSDDTLDKDKDFELWKRKQAFLKNNIKQVCEKYGADLSISVALKDFIFDDEHQLLFCRNAKVKSFFGDRIGA